jgi:hypothetical protein
MTKKLKKPMSGAHKQKLRDAYNKRKQAKEMGIHLPTVKEIRAAKAKKEPITEQSVNKLIENIPVSEQEGRVNTPAITRFESSPNAKHPLRFRTLHADIK